MNAHKIIQNFNSSDEKMRAPKSHTVVATTLLEVDVALFLFSLLQRLLATLRVIVNSLAN